MGERLRWPSAVLPRWLVNVIFGLRPFFCRSSSHFLLVTYTFFRTSIVLVWSDLTSFMQICKRLTHNLCMNAQCLSGPLFSVPSLLGRSPLTVVGILVDAWILIVTQILPVQDRLWSDRPGLRIPNGRLGLRLHRLDIGGYVLVSDTLFRVLRTSRTHEGRSHSVSLTSLSVAERSSGPSIGSTYSHIGNRIGSRGQSVAGLTCATPRG